MPEVQQSFLPDTSKMPDAAIMRIIKDNKSIGNISLWISAVATAKERQLPKPEFHAWWNVQVPLRLKVRLLQVVEQFWSARDALIQAMIFLESGCEQRLH